jgi:uncharacterized protein (TIGR03643 family)
MAWEDRTPFEAIALQFGLQEPQAIELMRQQMQASIKVCYRRVMAKHCPKLTPV